MLYWNFLFAFLLSCWCLIFKLHKQWIEQASEPNKEAIVKALLGAKDAMLGIRYHMRMMGEAAGVPVSSSTNWILIFIVLCLYVIGFPYKNVYPESRWTLQNEVASNYPYKLMFVFCNSSNVALSINTP